MSTFKEAAESALRLIRMLGDLATVSDTIARCGDLEAAEGEARLRLNNLNRELAEARDAIAEADAQAVARRAASDEEAAGIRAAADAYAAQARTDAEAQAAAIRAAAGENVEAAHQQVVAKQAEAQALLEANATAAKELQELEDRITRAKAKVAELLGA